MIFFLKTHSSVLLHPCSKNKHQCSSNLIFSHWPRNTPLLPTSHHIAISIYRFHHHLIVLNPHSSFSFTTFPSPRFRHNTYTITNSITNTTTISIIENPLLICGSSKVAAPLHFSPMNPLPPPIQTFPTTQAYIHELDQNCPPNHHKIQENLFS